MTLPLPVLGPRSLARRRFDAAATWWSTDASYALDLSDKSRRMYTDLLRLHVIPVIGPLQLRAIAPSDVGRVIAHMADSGLSPNYRLNAKKAISHVYRAAIANGAVLVNPTQAVRIPRESVREIIVPDRNQVLAMIEQASNERLRTFVMLAAFTGMRINEILNLRWADVKFDARTIVVRRGKGGKSRAVILPDPLASHLFFWRAFQRAELGLDSPWVIARGTGTMFDTQTWRRKHFAPLARVTCPGATPHSLRHSYATFLLEEGVPMRVVSDALGHTSTRITEDAYAHVTARLLVQADNAIVRALPIKSRDVVLLAA